MKCINMLCSRPGKWCVIASLAFRLDTVDSAALVRSAGKATSASTALGFSVMPAQDSPELTVDDAVDWLLKKQADASIPQAPLALIRRHAEYALRARTELPVAAKVPWSLFLQEVLPYRHFDEADDDWRGSFFTTLGPHIRANMTLREAAETVIPRAWTDLGGTVTFKPNMTPQAIAPVSQTLALGHASCTGCSILVADALRSVGLPARVVGTPEWNVKGGGNHNWVEVWLGEGNWSTEGWHFFDAAPSQGRVEWDKAWFTAGNVQKAEAGGKHGIYTPSWDSHAATSRYELPWCQPPKSVPALDRTAFYKGLPSLA